ncbi:MAG: FecR family protein, partial [Thermodesulfobacteriota bacterium]
MLRKTAAYLQGVVLLGLCLAAMAGAAEPQQAGYVVRVQGKAQVVNQALSRNLAVVQKMPLFQGDRITTQARSLVEIALADDSLLQIGAETTLDLTRLQVDTVNKTRDAELGLPLGKLQALVNDLFKRGQRKFEIKTQNAVAGVRGTLLMVLALSAKETQVVGYDHPVVVYNRAKPDKQVVVSQLHMTTVQDNEPPTPPQPITIQQFEGLQKSLQASRQESDQQGGSGGSGHSGAGQGQTPPLTTGQAQGVSVAPGDDAEGLSQGKALGHDKQGGDSGDSPGQGKALGVAKQQDKAGKGQGQGKGKGLQSQQATSGGYFSRAWGFIKKELGLSAQDKTQDRYRTKQKVLQTLSDRELPEDGRGLSLDRRRERERQGLGQGRDQAPGQSAGGDAAAGVMQAGPLQQAPVTGAGAGPSDSPGGGPGGGASLAQGSSGAPGQSGSAPGQGGGSPGNSGNAPGQGGGSPGNSG